MSSLCQQIEREVSKYSMRGDWRTKADQAILDKIASICNHTGFTRRNIKDIMCEWLLKSLCRHKDAFKYSSLSNPKLYKVAEKAARNICNRLF